MNRRRFILAAMGASAGAIPGISDVGAGIQASGEDAAELYGGLTLQEHRDELAVRLYDEYLPFWHSGGYDEEHGGFICNLTQEGLPVDDEKFIWYQGRAVWVYAFLYTNFGRDPKHLEIARKTRDFMVRHMYLGDGKWAELVRRDGKLIKGVGPGSDVYGWLFAANGLAQYYRISGKEEDLGLANHRLSRQP